MTFYKFLDLTPVDVTGGFGGAAEDAGLMISAGSNDAFNLILVVSFTGATIPVTGTPALLVTIVIPSAAESDVCLSSVVGEVG